MLASNECYKVQKAIDERGSNVSLLPMLPCIERFLVDQIDNRTSVALSTPHLFKFTYREMDHAVRGGVPLGVPFEMERKVARSCSLTLLSYPASRAVRMVHFWVSLRFIASAAVQHQGAGRSRGRLRILALRLHSGPKL